MTSTSRLDKDDYKFIDEYCEINKIPVGKGFRSSFERFLGEYKEKVILKNR